MNEPYQIIASLNSNISPKTTYSNNEAVQTKRGLLFDVVNTNKAINKKARVYRGNMNSPYFNFEGQVGNYTQSEALEKIKLLKNIVQDGNVYTLDFETIGKSILQNGEFATEADKLNNKYFAATEFAISKQNYKNGKAINNAEEVINFTSSYTEKELRAYMNQALTMKNPDSTILSSASRIAGYSNADNFKNGVPTGWISNAKINDEHIIGAGIVNLSENMKFKVNTPEYKEAVQNIYNTLENILNDDKAVIASFNGNVFDIPVMMGLFQSAGVNVSDTFKERLANRSIDAQQLFRNFLKPHIFKMQTDLKKSGVDVVESLSVENLIHVANSLGAGIDITKDTHVALTDTMNEGKILSTLLDRLFNVADFVENDIANRKVPPSTKAIYHANNAVMANDNDIFFIDSGYGNPNTYNKVLMESGHSYKISTYDINSKELPENLQEKIGDFKNKKIIKMEDIYEGYTRNAYLVTDSQKDIQDRLLNLGGVIVSNDTDEARTIAKKSTEIAFKDKARQTKDNFFNVNSDKGYKDFEMYMDMFGDYKAGNPNALKKDLAANIKAMSNLTGEASTYDALKKLFSRGKNGVLIHERAFNLLNLYDDFNMNHRLYQSMLGAVNDAVNGSELLKNNNFSNSASSKNLLNRVKTMALSAVREDLYNKALYSISDETALDYIIKNNEQLSLLIDSRVAQEKDKAILNSKVLTPENIGEIKREAFENFYGEKFSKNSNVVKNSIFGMAEIEGTIKDFEGIDILTPDGDYSRVQINDRNNFIKKIKTMVNAGVKAENSSIDASKRLRKNYLRTIVKDLESRGLIGSDIIDQFNNTSNVEGMIEAIGNGLYDTKEKFDSIVKLDKVPDYQKMTSDEVKFVRNYINKHNMKRVYTEGKGFTIMGIPAQDFLFHIDKDLYNNMIESANKSIPDFITNTYSATSIDSNSKIVKDLLKEKFNWTDSNVNRFMDRIINNRNLSTFEYATSGKKTNGLSHHIVTQGNKGYLISTPYDKEALIARKIATGLNIDEINNLAVVWEIPKVENYAMTNDFAGIPIIKQGTSDISYKAVTKDIKIKIGDDNGHLVTKLVTEDTIDTVIDSLGNKYKYAKELMEEGSFKAANRLVGRSWKSIHENKTLSSVVPRVSDIALGYSIEKSVSLSRADFVLPSMVNVSDLVYTLDTALKNENLKKSFYNDVINPGYILNQVSGYKAQLHSRVGSDYSKLGFHEWDKSFQVWFSDNISKIAGEILENPAFKESDADLISVLRSIKETGREGFFGKESGDANRGFFFIEPPKKYVAGSMFSGTSRPLVNQVMTAPNVNPEDMLLIANKSGMKYSPKYPKNIFKNLNAENDLRKVGIHAGHGYITESTANYVNISKEAGKGNIGFTAKTKIMSSGEFLDKINSLSLVRGKDQEAFQELINDKIFINAIDNSGINMEDITIEYIRKISRNIATATNLYEDSSLISPFISTLMSPKTVTSLSYDPDSTKFRIGEKITPGTIIKNKDGIVKVSDKNAGKIVGMKNGKLFIQLNNKYFNTKLGFGAEKTQMVTPYFGDYKDMAVTDAIIKHISGGASIITNPKLIKHESFNSLMSGYANAIGYGISSNEEMEHINKSLKEFIPGLDIKYKNIDGRYVLVEGNKTGAVSLENFENFINYMESNGNDEISRRIKDVKRNNLAYIDFVAMQDNTIQGYNGAENIGKGAAISYRSQSVMGAFIGDGEIDELSKYRKISDGKIANLWEKVMHEDVKQLASDPKFIKAQEQVQNIKVALASSINEGFDNVNIQKFDLDNGVVGSSVMQADELPNIFKYTPENRVHAYEIDISDLNVKLNNFIYDDLEKRDLHNIHKHILPNVEKIYIPALDANYMDEGYTLSMTQRKASDLINSLNNFRNSKFEGKSINEASQNLYEKYKEYIEALRYDLVAGDGLNKSSMKIKSKFSSRLKVAKVAAPITEKQGFVYKDLNFRNTSTIIGADGKPKYYGSVFVPKDDFLNQGVDFEKIGRQLVEENIDDSLESLEILKKNLGSDIFDVLEAKNLKQAREILAGHEISKKTYKKMGINFLEDVGIYGVIMRDPAMKPTSYQAVKIKMANLTPNTVSIDAVTASLINADVDGDEINLFFKGLFDSVDGVKVKNINDEEVSSLKEIMDIYSNHNVKVFYGLLKENAEREFTGLDIGKYIDSIGRDIEDIDNFNNENRFAAFLSRFTKSTIGQISNPNYYMRTAATYHFSNQPYDPYSYKKMKGILTLADMAEQKLIDVKSIKSSEGIERSEKAKRMANLAGNYRSAMDDLALKNNLSKRENAVSTLYRSLMHLTSEDGEIILGYNLSGQHGDMEEQIELAIKRILQGKVHRTKNGENFTLEEVIRYMMDVLDDDDSRELFFSQSIRQSDLDAVNGESISSLEATKRSLYQKFNDNDELMALVHGDNYLHSMPYLNGKYVSIGDSLKSLSDNGYIGEGVYTVSNIGRENTGSFIELTDTSNQKVIRVNGNSFTSISNKISHMENYSGEGFIDELTAKYTNEVSSSIKGYNKIKSIISSKIEDDFRYKAAVNAFKEYDANNLHDMFGTIEVLKSKGYVSNTDSELFIKNMNDAIRKKGTSQYRQAKISNLLNLKSFRKNTKVSSASSVAALLKNEVTTDSINNLMYGETISSIKNKLETLKRYDFEGTLKNVKDYIDKNIILEKYADMDLENLSKIKSKAYENVMSEINKIDKDNVNEMKKIFSEHSEDLDFINDVLGLKLEEIDDLIKNNAGAEAIDMINASKISYGQYIGFNIGELDDIALEKIASLEYDSSGVSNEIVDRTSNVIKRLQELKSEGYERTVNKSSMNISDNSFIKEAIKNSNSKIYSKGSVGKSGNFKGKSILDKISDVASKAKGNKGILYGVAAATGAIFAGSYIYGNSKLNEKEGQYVSKNTNNYNNPNAIKTNEDGTTRTRYTEVPSSNMGYYASNDGMSVDIRAKAPLGASGSDLNRTLSQIFGGSGVKINTSMSDTRKSIEDRDINEIMSMATRY